MAVENCKRVNDDPFVGLRVVRYYSDGQALSNSRILPAGSVLLVEDARREACRYDDQLRRRLARYDTFVVCEAISPAADVLDAAYPPGELRWQLDWLSQPSQSAVVVFAIKDRVAGWIERIGRARPRGAAVTLLTETGPRTIFNVGALFQEREAA